MVTIRWLREQIRQGKTIYDLPLRVTFYARVSTEKVEQQGSLENQIQYYTEFIQKNPNWTYVPGYIDEGISGTSTYKRDSFLRMIEDAKRGMFDFIITKEISRFSRNTLDSIQYTQELLDNNVGVLFQNDNINTLDSDSEFRLIVMAGVAQDEVRKLSERLKFGFRQSIKNGHVLGNNRLWGYDKKDCKLTIIPEQAEAVKLIFQLYATGNYGLRKLSQELTRRGYTSLLGNKFNSVTIGHNLQNPKYKGWYCGNKTQSLDYRKKKTAFLDESEWVTYPDPNIPAIVSEELWNHAQAKMKQHYRPTGVNGITQNPLAGLVHCSYCGNAMQRRPYLKTGQPASLICTTHFCPQISSPLYMVEGKILEALSLWMKQHEPTWEEESSADVFSTKIMALEHAIADMEQELQGLQSQFEKIFEFLETGIYTPEVFTARNKTLSEKMAEIRSAIEETQAELSKLKAARKNQVSMIPKIKNILDTYETLTPAEKNKLLKEVLDHVEYHKKIKGKKNVPADNFEIILFPKISPEN